MVLGLGILDGGGEARPVVARSVGDSMTGLGNLFHENVSLHINMQIWATQHRSLRRSFLQEGSLKFTKPKHEHEDGWLRVNCRPGRLLMRCVEGDAGKTIVLPWRKHHEEIARLVGAAFAGTEKTAPERP